MESTLAIGIDVGTTYSCVAIMRQNSTKPEVIPNECGKNTTPSFVAYDEEGDIYAGQTAKDLAFDNADSTVFDVKRLIGRSFYDSHIEAYKNLWPFTLVNVQGMVGIKIGTNKLLPQAITKELIAHLRTISENYLHGPIKSAVVTIPAYFNDLQQGLTREACHEAGLEQVRFIKEPTAAAYAYGLQSSIQPGQSKTCLIFDLGGGTFDVTIFKMGSQHKVEILATGGDARLGGEDFNDLLTEYCINEFKKMHSIDLVAGKDSEDSAVRLKTAKTLRKIRTDCEKQKIHLSNVKKVTISADAVCRDLDLVIPATRKIFEDLIDSHLKRCISTMDNLLKKSGIEKVAIDDVILIGGSTRIPKVQQVVSDFFGGKVLHKNINADEAVACGAAIYAHIIFRAANDADDAITVVEALAHMESYTSMDSIQPQQLVVATPIITKSTNVTDRSQELLISEQNTAYALQDQGKFKEALNLFENVYQRQVPILGEDHADTLTTKHNIAFCLGGLKEYSKAFDICKSVFEKRKRILGSNHESTLSAENNTAVTLRYQGKFKEALDLFEDVYQRQISTLGEDNVDTLMTRHEIAFCLNRLKEYSKAFEIYKIVFEKRKRILGSNHKSTLSAENNTAFTLQYQGKFKEALNLYEDVYQKRASTLGEDNVDTLETRQNIAFCLNNLKEYSKAYEIYKSVFEKRKRILGSNHESTLLAEHCTAITLHNQEKFKEALDLYEDVYQRRVSTVGEDNVDTQMTRHNIAFCLEKLGRNKTV